MNIFQRAWQGVDLSPEERALLKVFQGLFWTLIVAGGDAAIQYLAAQGNMTHINWSQLGLVSLGAIIVAIGQAANKYFGARGQAPLGAMVDTTLQGFASDLEGRMGTPDVEPIPAPAPAIPAPIPVAVSIENTIVPAAEGTP